MTDEERIAGIEFDVNAMDDRVCCTLREGLRWLLGEYRRLVEELADKRVAEIGRAADNARDAARWRYCERAAEPSDGNDAEPWWVLTACGPTFAEAVDAARKQVTTDWSGHQGGA